MIFLNFILRWDAQAVFSLRENMYVSKQSRPMQNACVHGRDMKWCHHARSHSGIKFVVIQRFVHFEAYQLVKE